MSFRVGFVPEHFSSPFFLKETVQKLSSYSLSIEWIECPMGTGQMRQMLEENKLDIAIGLTEGWVAYLANTPNANFKIIGSYVQSPLRWAISSKPDSDVASVNDLKDKIIGISRYGSGSHIMPFVMAQNFDWLAENQQPFKFSVIGNFESLRDSIKNGSIHSFMWEYFTTKKFFDNGELRHIGDIYTPWPSWMICARSENLSDPKLSHLRNLMDAINTGIQAFHNDLPMAISLICEKWHYTDKDAQDWAKTVNYTKDCCKLPLNDLGSCLNLLERAGVVVPSSEPTEQKEVIQRITFDIALEAKE